MMTSALGMRPLLVDAKHLSRAKRPRLFWFSVPLINHEEVEVHQGELYDEIIYGAATEPMHAVLEEGRAEGHRFEVSHLYEVHPTAQAA